MKSCSASSCSNTSFNSPHLFWHSLPQDALLRDEWMELLGIPDDDDDMEPPKVCSSHFKPNDFLSNNRFLKCLARPSLRLAKTVKPLPMDKDDLEDYVVSSEDEVSVVPVNLREKVDTPTPSSRPSRKAAQKAAEKLKRYCYESPPNSPVAPSTTRRQSAPSQSRTPVSQPPVAPTPLPIPIKLGNALKVVPVTTLKYMSGASTPVTTVRPAGVNVTHLPIIKNRSLEVAPPVKRTGYVHEKTGLNITLQLECYEELLTPAQVAKHQKMQADSETFNQTLRSFRAANIAVVHCNDPFVKVTNTVTMVNSQMTNGVGSKTLTPQTTNVSNSTPQRLNMPNTLIRTPTLIEHPAQPIQTLGPGIPQQAIILAPQNNMTNVATAAQGQQLSYKVLVDSRTGIVVGTVQQGTMPTPTVSTLQKPVQLPAVNTQPQTVNASASSVLKSAKPVSPTSIAVAAAAELPPPDGCVFAMEEGGATEVTAETLLNIRAISGSRSKWSIAIKLAKPILQSELEREKFFTEPLKWMIKMNLVYNESTCRTCTVGNLTLVPDDDSTDGFKWLCDKDNCAKVMSVQRLYFFSRFGSPLNRLLPLVFHWAMQSDISEVKGHLKVDTYIIRSIWRALQEVCTRALLIKAKKIGGPGKVVEIATAKLGPHFWVIAALERKSGYVRLKVVRSERDWNSFANLQKILEPWLLGKTVVMSPESVLRSLGRIGYVFTLVDKKLTKNTPHVLIHAFNVTKYLKKHLSKMFGQFKLNELKLDTVQGFLDELQWRNRFGKTPRDSFCYIFKDIAEQSGRMVSFPPSGLSGKTESTPVEVILSSDSSVSSDSDEESSPPTKSTLLEKRKYKVSTAAATNARTISNKKQPVEKLEPVVLDSYYYATKKADTDLSNAEVKGDYQFKCIVCKKVLDNNLKVMKHIVAHIENNRQRNPDLSVLTNCKYCFRDFDTPYSMQCHMEAVHLNTSNLSCQICNQAFSNTNNLCTHMRMNHVKAEMPYACQVCNFRSSFHRDVLDHFQQAHNSTDKLLCHYCLRVYSIRFSGPEQLGHLQNYYYHLYKHQCKSATKKCNACCLVFPNFNELKKHKAVDHNSYKKLKAITYGTPKAGTEAILVKEPNMKEMLPPGQKGRPGSIKRSRNSASELPSPVEEVDEVEEGDPIILSQEFAKMTCVECTNNIDPEHFSQRMKCSKCKFSSLCTKAFVEHMICQHSRTVKKRTPVFSFSPLVMDQSYFCPCGFKSHVGNVLANHLKSCGRKSCHPDWMRAVNSLVKLEPGEKGSQPMERGSAFFPPLVVLDENEVEYVNQTLSTIPEPVPGIKPGVSGRRKRSRESQDQAEADTGSATVVSPVKAPPAKKVCEEQQPSWLSALGLFRKPGSGEDNNAEKISSSAHSPHPGKEGAETKESEDELPSPEDAEAEIPSPRGEDEESSEIGKAISDNVQSPEEHEAESNASVPASPEAEVSNAEEDSPKGRKLDESEAVSPEEEPSHTVAESPEQSEVPEANDSVCESAEESSEIPDNQMEVDVPPGSASSSKSESDQTVPPVVQGKDT